MVTSKSLAQHDFCTIRVQHAILFILSHSRRPKCVVMVASKSLAQHDFCTIRVQHAILYILSHSKRPKGVVVKVAQSGYRSTTFALFVYSMRFCTS